MVTVWWPLEDRVSGAKGQSVHHSCCPALRGSRLVLGLNGLRVSHVDDAHASSLGSFPQHRVLALGTHLGL